jgi:hypothetical protein
MPSLIISAGPSWADSDGENPKSSQNSEVGDDYRASDFPEYSEKPLEEQLEPIAVIGMGEFNPALLSASDGKRIRSYSNVDYKVAVFPEMLGHRRNSGI